ncbi:hypothetical protein [Streptomyces ficellus]|uniref:hypothetical protein n=1 Tax=Streptomyces ficellus TaxID=1977088 RepID=UPI0025AF2783|nr:hypothetical protein [Streptomyces ficellus]
MIIGLLAPWAESFGHVMMVGLGMLALVGTPTLLLAIGAGLAHKRMEPGRFRGALVAPMLVFTFPCLAASTAEPLLFQIMVQLAFICYLMPVPLVPEKWVGRA